MSSYIQYNLQMSLSNVVVSKVPGITLFLRIHKCTNDLSYNSFQIVTSCNYALLSVTVKVSETFQEAIRWKPFQLHCRLLNDVGGITKAPLFLCWFQSRHVKISWSQRSKVRGYASMLSHCSLLRKFWPKPTGVLEHCGEGDTNSWFYLSGRFLLTAPLMQRRMSMYISLLAAKISVNYTSDFR